MWAASHEHATHESRVCANAEQLMKLNSRYWSGGGRSNSGGGGVWREHEIEGSLGEVSSRDRVEANGGSGSRGAGNSELTAAAVQKGAERQCLKAQPLLVERCKMQNAFEG